MADPGLLSRFTVVLWRPASPGNVGAVARAMKNMGFTRLALAEPRPVDDPDWFEGEARRMAWDAADVLASRSLHPSIESAVAGAAFVAGTTSKPPPGFEVLAPRALALRLLEAAHAGPVALLFGQESIGLTREALSRCQLLGSIPASDLYGSLNLAQAVLLFLYEIREAAAARETGAPESPARRAPEEDVPPSREEVEAFYGRLIEALDSIGFFEGSGQAHMVRELKRIFNRSLTTRRELAILEGIAHRIRLELQRRP